MTDEHEKLNQIHEEMRKFAMDKNITIGFPARRHGKSVLAKLLADHPGMCKGEIVILKARK